MKKFFGFLLASLFLVSGVEAAYRHNPYTQKLDFTPAVSEDDGSPTGTPGTLIFSNGTVTDNGDGTFNVTTGSAASAPSTDTFVVIKNSASLTAERFIAGTANQVSITDNGANSSLVIGTSQDISSASSPTFVNATLSGKTTGSVLFASTGGIVSQDTARLFWDQQNYRLGILTGTPQYTLDVAGDAFVDTYSVADTNGTLNNPGMARRQFVGAADTLFFRGGSVATAFFNNANNHANLTIVDGGDVGIGLHADTPTAQLTVSGDAASTVIFRAISRDTTTTFDIDAANRVAIWPATAGSLGVLTVNNRASTDPIFIAQDNGTEVVRIADGGNVGIGISPAVKFHVAGINQSFRLSGTDDTSPVYQQINTSASTGLGYIGVEGNAGGTVFTGTLPNAMFLSSGASGTALQLGSSGNVRATIDSSGNFGIYASSPTAQLTVSADSASTVIFRAISQDTTTTFDIDAANRVAIWPAAAGSLGVLTVNNRASTDPIFVAQDNGTEVLRIADGGNIGIGIANPSQLLHINGAEATAYAASSGSLTQPAGGINTMIQNTTADGMVSLRFAQLSGSSNAIGYIGFINDGAGDITGSFVFGQRTGVSTYAEQMRLNDVGNFGIGTTQPQSTLQVDGTARVNRIGVGVSTDGTALITTRGQAAVSIDNYGASAGNTGEIRFKELAANGQNYVAVKASDDIAANVTWSLPAADGTVGQVLSTGGDGILRFVAAGAGGWTDGGAVIRLDTSTDDVVVGGTASLGKLGVLGDSDEAQLVVRGNGAQSTPILVVENPQGVDYFSVYGNPAMTGANLMMGTNAGDNLTDGTFDIMIGTSAGTAATSANNVISIGRNSALVLTTGSETTICGSGAGQALTTQANNTIFGYLGGGTGLASANNSLFGAQAGNSLTSGNNNICLGYLGGNDLITESNHFVAGDASSPITNVFFGEGLFDGSPVSYTINGTNGTGTNITGGNVTISGGQGTGTGAGGKFIVRSSPAGSTGSAGNVSYDIFTVTSTRNVLVNTSSDFTGVTQIFTPDDGVGINVSIDAVQAGITASDVFMSFDSKTGEEGSIAGTAAPGVIAFNTFTGSHWTKIDDKTDLEPCMVLIATGEKWLDSKQQLVKAAVSTQESDVRVYGVYGGTNKDGYDYVLALGTAFIWVTPTNGDIEIGDYLESSPIRGLAQKQHGRLLLNSTVAKALESVQWIPGEKRRKIACTLHAG